MSINTYLYINLASIPSKARYTKGFQPGRLINLFFIYIESLDDRENINTFRGRPS